ncbi:GGDEF domain-containing protein [Aliikangiella coralliicola]|uniref:diguanylate cyclase n=1 Tax=Aliikangiella coralliicola TaxID=2592383 RepID=A0A545UAT7_9GAMM|nr:GGDEF domain-containing protein [Aliikangiella coralliicola]TQV86568.1 GGDEF domain-containing protein [Aliikangiella coralliicola]
MSEQIQETIKESGHISRQAMAWLRDLQLPADPVCYHVAYELFHRPNPEMKQRVAQLHGTPDEMYEGFQQIYQDFITSKQENNLRQFSRKIDNLANRTLFNVSDTQIHLKAYSGTLEEIQPLLEATSGDAKINVISLLINETEKVHRHAESLEDKLKLATEEIKALQEEHLQFKDKVNRDPLTQVLNRSGLQEAFENLADEDNCYPMAVLLADIDHFKAFNDEHGHLIGDNVLKLVSATLKKYIKRSDILARFGGEEFLLLLPHTEKENGAVVAESLRKRIEKLTVKKKGSDEYLRRITISIGVSDIQQEQSLTDGIDRADKALYRSKNNGRNCVNIV